MAAIRKCDERHDQIVAAEYEITIIAEQYDSRESFKDYCGDHFRSEMERYKTGGIHPLKSYTIKRL